MSRINMSITITSFLRRSRGATAPIGSTTALNCLPLSFNSFMASSCSLPGLDLSDDESNGRELARQAFPVKIAAPECGPVSDVDPVGGARGWMTG